MSVSFEFFPPRTPEAEGQWWTAIERLAALHPAFVSVTCGAGGSGVEQTLDSLRAMTAHTDLRLAGHLTCVGRSRQEVDDAIAAYWDTGVRQVLALRGDMPDGAPFTPRPDGYASSVELIEGVLRVAPFEVSVAVYPQRHPDSISPSKDLDWLARKVEAGATRAITQFCFDTHQIVRLRDAIDFAGIEVNLVAGILPATNFKSVSRFAGKCGVTLPDWLQERFAGLDDDRQTRMALAAIVAAEQVERLSREGFREFHFFTMNNYDVVPAVCRLIDVGEGEPEVSAR